MNTDKPELDVVGEWWLPGREDRKLPGTLSFNSEHGGRLKLIGGVLMDPMEIAETTIEGDSVTIVVRTEDIEMAGSYQRNYLSLKRNLVTYLP